MKRNKGFQAVEYAFLIILTVAALVGMSVYLRRAVSGKYRAIGDTFGYGRQYQLGQSASIANLCTEPEGGCETGTRWSAANCCCGFWDNMVPCFVTGTPITMADGSVKPIEKIKTGDLVLVYQEKDKKIKAGKVNEIFSHPKRNKYLLITTADNRKIKTTLEHLIFTGKGYEPAGKLKTGGMVFVLAKNELKPVRVKSTEIKKETVDLYNFHVSGIHNFFAEGILFHNGKCEDIGNGRCSTTWINGIRYYFECGLPPSGSGGGGGGVITRPN